MKLLVLLPLVAYGAATQQVSFFVGDKEVKPYFVDKTLQGRSVATLMKMHECGSIKAHKLSDGDYRISYNASGKGGGKFCAWAAYLGIKAVGYGVMFVSFRRGVDRMPEGAVRDVAHHVTEQVQEHVINAPNFHPIADVILEGGGRVAERIVHNDQIAQDVVAVEVGTGGGLVGIIEAFANAAYYTILPLPCP